MRLLQSFFIFLTMILVITFFLFHQSYGLYRYDASIGGSSQIADFKITESIENITLRIHLVKPEPEPDFMVGAGQLKPYIISSSLLGFPMGYYFNIDSDLTKYDDKDYFVVFYPNIRFQAKLNNRLVYFKQNQGSIHAISGKGDDGIIFIIDLKDDWKGSLEVEEKNTLYEIYTLVLTPSN